MPHKLDVLINETIASLRQQLSRWPTEEESTKAVMEKVDADSELKLECARRGFLLVVKEGAERKKAEKSNPQIALPGVSQSTDS